MTIKAVVNTAPERKEKPFPKLMQTGRGGVLLAKCPIAADPRVLACISLETGESLDYRRKHLTDFHGSITLSNGEGE